MASIMLRYVFTTVGGRVAEMACRESATHRNGGVLRTNLPRSRREFPPDRATLDHHHGESHFPGLPTLRPDIRLFTVVQRFLKKVKKNLVTPFSTR